MNAILRRLQFRYAGRGPVPVSEAFVELRDMFAQHPDFLLHDLTGLVGGPTGLLRALEFFGLSGRNCIELTDSPVPFSERPLESLDDAADGRFPITQFHLQLMNAILGLIAISPPGCGVGPGRRGLH